MLTDEQIQAIRQRTGIQPQDTTLADRAALLHKSWGDNEPPPPDLLSRAGSFIKENNIPGAQLGEALGTSLSGITESIRQGSMKPLLEAGKENLPKVGTVAGDVTRSAVIPASLAVPAPEAATILGAGLKTGLQTAGLGAIAGAGESASKGNDPVQVAKDAFQSGVTGGIAGFAGGAAGKALSEFLAKSPQSVYNHVLGVTAKLDAKGKSPSDFLIDEGTWGSLGAFKKAATEGMKTEEAVINQAAASTPGGTTYDDVLHKAFEFLKKSNLGDLYSDADIEQMLKSVPVNRLSSTPGEVSWVDADGVRSALGSKLSDARWLQQNPTENTQAVQAIYGALSDAIKKATGTEDNFARYSRWIQTNKLVDKALHSAAQRYARGIMDTASGAAGVLTGAASGDDITEKIKNAIIGGVVGVGAERALTSPTAQTGVAQILTQVGKLPTDAMGRISKTAIMELIARLTANTHEETQTPQSEAQ